MSKYLLLQVHKNDSSIHQYVGESLGFSHDRPYGKPKVTHRTKSGAKHAVDKLRKKGEKYPILYGLDPNFKWEYDLLSSHPEYSEYLKDMAEFKKQQKRIDRLPVVLRSTANYLVKPRVPLGTVPIGRYVMSTPSIPFRQTPAFSTSDDYDALVLQVADLAHKLQDLSNRLDMAMDSGDDAEEAQRKALVAFGSIIKGLDDRIEDLEHNLRP
jgi:hypothetical protein